MTDDDPALFAADEQTDVALDVGRYLRLARLVLESERVAPDVEMSLLFVNEEAIAQLNERFLGVEGATDVLAFPMDDDALPGGRQPDQGGRGPGSPSDPGDPPTLLGDVIVCPAVAARHAEARAEPLAEELALLVVHGVLHLLNYDHAEPDDAAVMQRRERELLGRFAEIEERS